MEAEAFPRPRLPRQFARLRCSGCSDTGVNLVTGKPVSAQGFVPAKRSGSTVCATHLCPFCNVRRSHCSGSTAGGASLRGASDASPVEAGVIGYSSCEQTESVREWNPRARASPSWQPAVLPVPRSRLSGYFLRRLVRCGLRGARLAFHSARACSNEHRGTWEPAAGLAGDVVHHAFSPDRCHAGLHVLPCGVQHAPGPHPQPASGTTRTIDDAGPGLTRPGGLAGEATLHLV